MDKTEFIRQNVPCYIYDKRMIEHNCKQLCEAMPEVQFLYSVKTNPFMPVLQTVACQGFGADAASANEVQKAEQAGIPASFIYYSSPGKTDADLKAIWERCIIIADSLSELDWLLLPPFADTSVYDEVIAIENEKSYEMAKRPENKGKTIVALLPDSGDRYYSTKLFIEKQ